MSDPAAVLFDLDCTLIARSPSIVRYAERFAESFASRLASADVETLHAAIVAVDRGGYHAGTRSPTLVAELPWTGPVSPVELDGHWEREFPGCVVEQWGARALLTELRLRGLATGVVTNGTSRAQRPKLEALGLVALLDCVVISEEARVEKPGAGIFERALRELDVEAKRAWFVGDHPRNDVLGASAAGLTGVWLRGSHAWPAEADAPERAIDLLEDLLPLLDAAR